MVGALISLCKVTSASPLLATIASIEISSVFFSQRGQGVVVVTCKMWYDGLQVTDCLRCRRCEPALAKRVFAF